MLFLILCYVLCQLCRGSYTCFYDLVCRLLSSFARTSLKESRVGCAPLFVLSYKNLYDEVLFVLFITVLVVVVFCFIFSSYAR